MVHGEQGQAATMSHIHSFSPLAAPDATCLLLGSMPGKASLAAQQYYAHPRNAFWPLLTQLLALPTALAYADRCKALLHHRIAVWDVLHTCTRASSLDSDIDTNSIVPNDFAEFFAAHPAIHTVFFNGVAAATIYRRHVLPTLPESSAALPRIQLPSTSPAHAALDFGQKLALWTPLVTASGGATC